LDLGLFYAVEVIFGSKGKSYVNLQLAEEFLNLRIIELSKQDIGE